MHIATFKVQNSILASEKTYPLQFDGGTASNNRPVTPIVLFRQQYFEALDSICILRFQFE